MKRSYAATTALVMLAKSRYNIYYLCKKCFNATEKYLSAKDQFQRLEQDLTDKITKTPPTHEGGGIVTSTASRGTKKKAPHTPDKQTVKARLICTT